VTPPLKIHAVTTPVAASGLSPPQSDHMGILHQIPLGVVMSAPVLVDPGLTNHQHALPLPAMFLAVSLLQKVTALPGLMVRYVGHFFFMLIMAPALFALGLTATGLPQTCHASLMEPVSLHRGVTTIQYPL
jgi:hypothetical protein